MTKAGAFLLPLVFLALCASTMPPMGRSEAAGASCDSDGMKRKLPMIKDALTTSYGAYRWLKNFWIKLCFDIITSGKKAGKQVEDVIK